MPQLIIMAGDGIGPEVVGEARRVIHWFIEKRGLEVDLKEELYGISAWHEYGTVMRPEAWAMVEETDAIMFGASGTPAYDELDRKEWLPDRLLQMRKKLDLFDNRRPVRMLDGLVANSTLKPEIVSGVDMLIVRELTGGIYFSEPRGEQDAPSGGKRTVNTMAYSAWQVERIAHTAFEMARKRRNKVCSVDKANATEVGELWRDTVIRVHDEHYPDVALSHMYVDNAAMQLVRNPKQFDVILTENMFGDILSDCAAMVSGSIGMMPSASIGPVKANGRRTALYEPIHGSAPDIAGKGVANPMGAIMSFAMCLDFTFGLPDEAAFLTSAVEKAIADGARTADIAAPGETPINTVAMGDAVLRALEALTAENNAVTAAGEPVSA